MISRSSLGNRSALHETAPVALLFAFAPVFFAFELWQLVIAERYLGLKQIARGIDPRELGLGELTAACWSLALLAYWAWMALMLFQPLGRFQFLMLLGVTDLASPSAAAVDSNGCW